MVSSESPLSQRPLAFLSQQSCCSTSIMLFKLLLCALYRLILSCVCDGASGMCATMVFMFLAPSVSYVEEFYFYSNLKVCFYCVELSWASSDSFLNSIVCGLHTDNQLSILFIYLFYKYNKKSFSVARCDHKLDVQFCKVQPFQGRFDPNVVVLTRVGSCVLVWVQFSLSCSNADVCADVMDSSTANRL